MAIEGYTAEVLTPASTNFSSTKYKWMRIHYVATEVPGGYSLSLELQMKANGDTSASTETATGGTTTVRLGSDTIGQKVWTSGAPLTVGGTSWVTKLTATHTLSALSTQTYQISVINANMTGSGNPELLEGTVSGSITLPAVGAASPKFYGSVNDVTKLTPQIYGSVDGRSRSIQKIYGSVDGLTKLVHLDLGQIPRPGLVTYYTDNTYTTTATVQVITQADFEALHNPGSAATWNTTINGVTISNRMIKEVVLPNWATTIGNRFLDYCDKLDTFTLPPSITTIGDRFLNGCSIFDQPLDLFYVQSIGEYFLSSCVAFNQTLDISRFTSIPDRFLMYCDSFNQPLDTSNVTSFGYSFLYGCSAFDQSLDLSSAQIIGPYFLHGNTMFNQDITIPYSASFVGAYFMYNCKDMTSIVTCNAPASVASVSDYTFSTDDNTADCYTQGIQIAGGYATEWKTKFANRDVTPYRNLGYASVPILYNTEIDSFTSSQAVINYGVSSWDMTETYTSGTVTLYGGTTDYPTTMLSSYNAVGVTQYTHTGLTGNTKYNYRVEAINNGNKSAENRTSVVTKPKVVAITIGSPQYITYNTYKRTFTLDIPANGNAYPQTIEYQTSGGGEISSWTTVGTYSSAQAGTMTVDITLETDKSYTVSFRTTTTAGSSTTGVVSPSVPTHTGPEGVEFTLDDANTSVQTWLATFDGYSLGNWFISGQSTPRVTITDPGTTTDGATLTQYEAFITNPDNHYSHVIPYSVSDMTYTFDKASIASLDEYGVVMARVDAQDSLQAINPYYEGGMFLSWASPTFDGGAERIGRIGGIKLTFSGQYSGLSIGALNHGDDLNVITLEYRVLDYAGGVLTDWTEVPSSRISVTENSGNVLNRNYSGVLEVVDLDYVQSISVEIRASDHFKTLDVINIPLNTWNAEQVIKPAVYEIELWDWKTNTFVADLSYLVAGELSINWELNDIEEIDFSLDLVNFEKKCQEMRTNSRELLVPYKHDIRIRRNGKYILGCQLVEANIQIPNNSPALINVKCTGFLNLFKDQYILDEAWSGYTYAEIARKLVTAAQKPDCLVKNPTGDIDTSYWLAANGTVSSSTLARSGDRCVMGSKSGSGWITMGTQMSVDSGENILIDVWVKGQNGATCALRERQYVTQSANQNTISTLTMDGSWQHIQVGYQTFWQNGYLVVEMNRTDSSTNLYVDDCYVYAESDEADLCDLKVTLGQDTASSIQQNNRQVDYSLQNVKDAMMDLIGMEDDNFDFDFSYDRVFNCYARKGSEKLGVEILYPGNVETMTIGRSASNLANKVYNIGSGIGDERLQVKMSNTPSRAIYGTRESIITNSNVELESTLTAQAIGNLYDRKDPTDLPTVTVRDGSINPDIVQVGDSVPVSIQGDGYLETINGIYRIMKIALTVDTEGLETMKLTFEPPEQRPEKRMIRYIRDTVLGNSVNGAGHWAEVQALMLVGNEYVNVAQGAAVYGRSSLVTPERAVDGIIIAGDNYAGDGGSGRKAVTIDLGDEYPIDYVKVWHYYGDSRKYYGNHLSVGTTLPDGTSGTADLETILWQYEDDAGYTEISDGKRSTWLQEGRVMQNEES